MDEGGADAGYIAASKHRTAVARRLADSPAVPKQIKTDTGRLYSRVFEPFGDLRDEGLVGLLTPDDRGRLYVLTDSGQAAWEFMCDSRTVQ